MQPRRLVFFALAAAALLPSVAHAAQIAVLAPQLKPPGATELRDRFHDAVTRSMSKAGDVMPAADVRAKLASQPDLLNCVSGACVRQAALALGVERVVTVDVEYVGKDYSIRIHAFNAAGGELGAVPEEKCDICTVREAARASERAADRAVASVASGLAAPAVPAAPAAPPVAVGITDTPPARPATPPAATPPAATPPAATPPAATPPAATPPVAAETPPPAATTPAAPMGGSDKGSSTYRIGAYTAFGVAGAALVAMIPFAYYASKEQANTRGLYTGAGCDSSVPAAMVRFVCPEIYSGNKAPAVVFGVGAALAAATGGLLLYLDSKQKRSTASFIGVPTRDGFAVSGTVEF